MSYPSIKDVIKKVNFRPQDHSQMPQRRYDLDWLRVILFSLLIIHHVGMFYVLNWGFHAKSQYRYEWLESVLLVVEPWRMPAIWFISGVAIRFILIKVTILSFISLRSLRLLLPLAFGIFIVVPPQLYIEMTANGDIVMDFWRFMQAFYDPQSTLFEQYQAGIWPHIDVNHLWYLRSLWYYSLTLVFLLPALNSNIIEGLKSWLASRHGFWTVLCLIVCVFAVQIIWRNDETRYPIGFLFLMLGYLVGWHTVFWQKLLTAIRPLCASFIVLCICFLIVYNLYYLDMYKGIELPHLIEAISLFTYSALRIVGLFLVLALSHRFLTKKTQKLAYFNEAVYPFYLLHQSIILVAGYYLTQLSLGAVFESLILLFITTAMCFLLFELIKRIELLRPFFGLKMQGSYPSWSVSLGYIIGGLLISPLIYQLIF
ncbi:acyltransferase family protein [Thalassotalea sp. PP2-459]|uniref:acyltransferase family protein n=1 Tax=Thalassotalea sp. PP2-459 TaxID=1742724 RepID=UPI0009426168|nr:acyltransferase family protein [Thalassotalea sp. PP2-459]OKY25455.1 hypothetical protein BI291_16430 [Thalassotalea sp. PP2-459]